MTNQDFLTKYPTDNDQIKYYANKVEECFRYFEIDEDYTRNGILDNVCEWYESKKRLFDILRHHPNWNEEAKAVVFLADEEREIDIQQFADSMNKLSEFIYGVEEPSLWQKNVIAELKYQPRSNINKFVTQELHDEMMDYHDVDFPVGSKLSRAIQRIYKNYEKKDKMVIDATTFVSKDENGIVESSFNKLFPPVADSINPLRIKRITILSANILDFLTMSHGNSWASCHYINSHGLYHNDGSNHYQGCYKAGTLSYAIDENSMIFYTLPKEYEGDQWWREKKITRTVFAYNDDVLLQSRLYPQSYDGEAQKPREYRQIVQKILSDCENKPNFWEAPKKEDEIYKYVITGNGALQYEDYYEWKFGPVISIRKSDFEKTYNEMTIGKAPYCIYCGDQITNAEHLCCDDCFDNDEKECANCGCCESEADMYYDRFRQDWYCRDCVEWCSYHESYEFSDDVCNRTIHGDYICDDAIGDGDFYSCEDCGEYGRDYDMTYCEDGCYRCSECAREWRKANFKVCEDCGSAFYDPDYSGEYCEECREEHEESENEIEILETTEPNEEVKIEFKYYCGTVRCVNPRVNSDLYTKDKVYTFDNGKLKGDNGFEVTYYGVGFVSFEEFRKFSSAQWVEVV